jgi:hypothetical protein
LWWEFLRRNHEYRQCCLDGGDGRLNSLYKDFGDIYTVDFKTWWKTDDRGAYLFSEEPLAQFGLVPDINKISNHEDVLLIQVPLSLPKRYLQTEFLKLLDQHHQGKRGIKTNRISTARYKISGHIDLIALQKCLLVYDMRIENPKLPLWQIAQKCRLGKRENWITDADLKGKGNLIGQISDKKMILANTASRLIKKAERIIEGTADGVFPKLK